MLFGSRQSYLRRREPDGEARVEVVELFFDLVFVFAITQLSHYLLHGMTPARLAQAALLLLATWWVWVYTAWCTNWLDPQRMPVRIMLFSMMLAGLFLTVSIPEAFAGRGLTFALAYVGMQLGRTGFMLWSLRRHSGGNYRNFRRIFVWLAVSAVFWLAGGLIGDPVWRFASWLAALAIEYVSPSLGFRVPGLGVSETTDWDVAGGHLAERVGLFVIIALGESVIVAGAAFSGSAWDAATVAAFVAAFVGIIAMWWIYFNIGADYASRTIMESADPGRIARIAYTYLPIVIIAAIIIVAVGDELLLAHPVHGAEEGVAGRFIVGGAALYLLGNGLFKAFVFGRWPLSHLAGLGLLAAVFLIALGAPALVFGIASSAVLVVVAAWEYISLKSLRD